MNAHFSAASQQRLALAHPELQRLMNLARDQIAFEVDDSQRGRAAQEKAFAEHKSKAHFGQSAHNWSPAIAVDIHPVPLDWNNTASFIALSKVILPLAKQLSIPIRWGGDWDGDGNMANQTLHDLPHYELTPWQEYAKHCQPFGG